MSTVFVSPSGSGDLSGSSIANAARLTSLNSLIAKAGPGGEVLLIADQGSYSLSADLQLNQGGATIRGISSAGQPMQAEISATTASIFILRNGADNLAFQDLILRDTTGGYGALRIAGNVRGLVVDNVDASNVRTFLAVGPSSGETASIDGLLVSNVEVIGYTSGAIKIAGNSNDITLRDIVLDGQFRDPTSFMLGVHLNDTAHNILIERVTASNNLYTGSAYYNGDGFVAEAGVYNVIIRDTVARNNGDAGYDIKSSNTQLINALAEGNKKNFRFWGDSVTAENITGRDPVLQGSNSSQDQVWIAGGSNVRIDGATFTDADPRTIVFNLETGSQLTLSNAQISKSAEATLEFLEGTARIFTAVVSPPVQPATGAGAGAGGWGDSAGAPTAYLGNASDEVFRGEEGDDFMRGGAGDDSLLGGGGFDDMHGNTGRDTLSGGLGDDWVVGGQDSDLLHGDDGADLVYGNLGDDSCFGGAGVDWLRGGQDQDLLSGGDGDDFLSGDRGDDTISGGAGADEFYTFKGAGLDLVVDFNAAEGDRVLLDKANSFTVTQVGDDTVIALDGAQMVLQNVNSASLPSGWILIA